MPTWADAYHDSDLQNSPPPWAVLTILAALLQAALVAQVQVRGDDATTTVTVNVGQSASLEWGFVYSTQGGFCRAESRLWDVHGDRRSTFVLLRLDRFLRDRTGANLDWQLADAPGRSQISSRRTVDDRRAFDYRAILTYELGGRRVRHGGSSSFYRVVAYEERPPAPPIPEVRPYRDTLVYMEAPFMRAVILDDGANGRAVTQFELGIYARSRPPSGDGWGAWTEQSMVLELPTAGLARAIRKTWACVADLPR